jgi:hypothetical protein
MRRRIHRVLVVAVFLAAVAGLWPSPAQASISCKVQIYRFCSAYVCCFQICTICMDQQGNIIDVTCGDAYCYNRND